MAIKLVDVTDLNFINPIFIMRAIVMAEQIITKFKLRVGLTIAY